VPVKIKIEGERATFTITITYDTQELYGRVTESRRILIEKQ